MKQQWLYSQKCQYMVSNVIGGLHGKCQAELSDFFRVKNDPGFLLRDPELCTCVLFPLPPCFLFHQLVILPTYPFIAGTCSKYDNCLTASISNIIFQ